MSFVDDRINHSIGLWYARETETHDEIIAEIVKTTIKAVCNKIDKGWTLSEGVFGVLDEIKSQCTETKDAN